MGRAVRAREQAEGECNEESKRIGEEAPARDSALSPRSLSGPPAGAQDRARWPPKAGAQPAGGTMDGEMPQTVDCSDDGW